MRLWLHGQHTLHDLSMEGQVENRHAILVGVLGTCGHSVPGDRAITASHDINSRIYRLAGACDVGISLHRLVRIPLRPHSRDRVHLPDYPGDNEQVCVGVSAL